MQVQLMQQPTRPAQRLVAALALVVAAILPATSAAADMPRLQVRAGIHVVQAEVAHTFDTRARGMGILDPKRKYDMTELAADDVIVSATGVTDGALMAGVRFHRDVIETETVVYRSITGTVRRIHGEHRELGKFLLE